MNGWDWNGTHWMKYYVGRYCMYKCMYVRNDYTAYTYIDATGKRVKYE